MQQQREAIEQFEQVLVIEPHDQLSREQLDALRGVKELPHASVGPGTSRTNVAGGASVAASGAASGVDAKSMGLKSLKLGYIPDAIKYLERAHDDDPEDEEVTLKLAWAYNAAKRNDEA